MSQLFSGKDNISNKPKEPSLWFVVWFVKQPLPKKSFYHQVFLFLFLIPFTIRNLSPEIFL